MDIKRLLVVTGLLLTVLLTAFLLMANDEGAERNDSPDNFYYCGGRTVSLYEHPSKVVRLAFAKGANDQVAMNKMKLIIDYQDTILKVSVYEYIELNSQRRALEMLKMNLLPCYYDESGTELIPSGMLDVRLKRIEDFEQLGKMVAPYNCNVIGDKPYYEKFCMLYVDPASGQNPVDVSRKLFESGMFLSSNPDFHFTATDF